MELQSPKFVQAVEKVIASEKPIISIVSWDITILWLKISGGPSSS